jgi:hypothetical protein
MKPAATEQPEAVARLAAALTGWTERWVPGTFICGTARDGSHRNHGLDRDCVDVSATESG